MESIYNFKTKCDFIFSPLNFPMSTSSRVFFLFVFVSLSLSFVFFLFCLERTSGTFARILTVASDT